MDSYDAAWLAGLLEGEGWFMLTKNYRNGRAVGTARNPLVALTMRDEDVVRRAADLMGGSVLVREPRKPGHSRQYQVGVKGHKAQSVLRAVRPYLGKRRGAKADEILAVELKGSPRGGQVRRGS